MASMQQLSLDFTILPQYRTEDFIVSDANREAYEWMMRWPEWPSHAVCLFGPPFCGKTHLAHLWAQKADARFLSYEDLYQFNPRNLPLGTRNYILEDEGEGVEEIDFLHFYNYVKEQQGYFLMTSPISPAHYEVRLPDLKSRLNSIPAIEMYEPDDELLAALLLKLLSDRQLKVDKEVVEYILPRIDRSFTGVAAVVSRIDKSAMEEQRKVTIPFVRSLLEE